MNDLLMSSHYHCAAFPTMSWLFAERRRADEDADDILRRVFTPMLPITVDAAGQNIDMRRRSRRAASRKSSSEFCYAEMLCHCLRCFSPRAAMNAATLDARRRADISRRRRQPLMSCFPAEAQQPIADYFSDYIFFEISLSAHTLLTLLRRR
jgi:hypothetical protein